jgi:hypothetical protein
MNIDFNQRIYVMDGGLWSVWGRFKAALKDTELVKWEAQDGELVLPICIVSYLRDCQYWPNQIQTG